MQQRNRIIFAVAMAVVLAGCTPTQKSSVNFSGEYTFKAIAVEKK